MPEHPPTTTVDALPGGAVLLDVAGARLGQVDDPAAFHLLDADQTLVLQLRHRRVDRARAGPPHPAGPLTDLLDDLVAVPRLLRDEGEDGAADVAARGPPAAATAAPGEAARRPARTERRSESGAASPERASATPAAAEVVAIVAGARLLAADNPLASRVES